MTGTRIRPKRASVCLPFLFQSLPPHRSPSPLSFFPLFPSSSPHMGLPTTNPTKSEDEASRQSLSSSLEEFLYVLPCVCTTFILLFSPALALNWQLRCSLGLIRQTTTLQAVRDNRKVRLVFRRGAQEASMWPMPRCTYGLRQVEQFYFAFFCRLVRLIGK